MQPIQSENCNIRICLVGHASVVLIIYQHLGCSGLFETGWFSSGIVSTGDAGFSLGAVLGSSTSLARASV